MLLKTVLAVKYHVFHVCQVGIIVACDAGAEGFPVRLTATVEDFFDVVGKIDGTPFKIL